MEPDRKIIKQYFLRSDISVAQLSGNDNSLMTLYYKKKNPKFKDKSEWTIEEKHIASYLKKQNKNFLTRAEVDGWTDIGTLNQPKTSSNSTWPLIIGLFIIGIIFLGGLVIFLRAKKRKRLKW